MYRLVASYVRIVKGGPKGEAEAAGPKSDAEEAGAEVAGAAQLGGGAAVGHHPVVQDVSPVGQGLYRHTGCRMLRLWDGGSLSDFRDAANEVPKCSGNSPVAPALP